MSTDKNTVRGQVVDSLPNLEFKVKIGDREIRCYTSGKMRINKIKVLIGDAVDVVLPPNSPVGRIVRRD